MSFWVSSRFSRISASASPSSIACRCRPEQPAARGRSLAVQRTRCLAPGDDLERSWLEAVEYLAEPCHLFLVAGEGTPTPDGRHVRPWAEADERLRVFQVAEKQRGSFESFAVAPIDPLAPTPDELVLASCPHAPSRVRVRLIHQPSL